MMIDHGVSPEEVGEWNGINRKPIKKYVVVISDVVYGAPPP